MINEQIYEMEIQQLTQLCVNMCQHMCQCWLIYIYLHKSPSIRYEWIYLPNLSPGQGQDCCHWSLILKQLRNGRNLTLVVDVSWKWLNYVEFYFLNRGTISCYTCRTPKQNLTAIADFFLSLEIRNCRRCWQFLIWKVGVFADSSP